MRIHWFTAACLALVLVSCESGDSIQEEAPGKKMMAAPVMIQAGKPVPGLPREVHFKNVRQLTFGGENAEAYWSNDGKSLIFQRKAPPHECDQIFILDLETGQKRLVSTGKGRTTCSYFLRGDAGIVYASTHLGDENCPPEVGRRGGKYVWAIYESYDIFVAGIDGSGLKRLTEHAGYDAEATVCPVTGDLVFTSVRDGDLELYTMKADGSDVRRVTNRPGYDGGAFFSHDGQKLVQRSGFLETPEQEKEYFDLLRQGLVQPTHMEITVLDRDGSNFRQVTRNGKANFAPFWHPDNRRIIFASNVGDPRGRDFDLYLIDETGENQEQVTFNTTFDSFPMFSPDGKYLVFGSNRYNPPDRPRDTNLFIAEWVEE